jgi:hypothetical protein
VLNATFAHDDDFIKRDSRRHKHLIKTAEIRGGDFEVFDAVAVQVERVLEVDVLVDGGVDDFRSGSRSAGGNGSCDSAVGEQAFG